MTKVFILGIDGAPPELIFDKWLDELPNIKRLMEEGCHREVESSMPPLTCCAWPSFFTGKGTGDSGLFDYAYRINHEYSPSEIISAECIKHKAFWQTLSEMGKKSAIFGVPMTWPIKPFNGVMITGFMTPGTDCEYTFPAELRGELRDFLGRDYMIDIEEYKNLSKDELKEKVYDMTKMHFEVIKYLMQNKPWDLFFGVLIGSDRMNHNFWRFFDEKHRKYEQNSPYKNELKDYYKLVDKELGGVIELLDKDTIIIVCSDHGTTRLHNRINLSDWLIKEGYLVLKEPIKEKCRLSPEMVDWKKTRVFAFGTYEGHIFINLKGREPEGIVEEKDADELVKELERKLKEIHGDDGEELNTNVFLRKRDYDGEARDVAPDMMVYFDNLEYGSNASIIGNGNLWSPMIAAGSDDAVHSREGIFIMKDGKCRGRKEKMNIEDIAKVILSKFN